MAARRGIWCRHCGGALEVERTERPCAGVVRRYRRCRACGAVWRTRETVDRAPPGKGATGSALPGSPPEASP